MAVVVTGAAGFLGAAVLRELATRGIDAVGVDRRGHPATGPAPGGRTTSTLRADLLDHDPRVQALLCDADAVIHLAARPGVRDRDPGIARARHRDNVLATAAVLGATPGRTTVVVASSSSVYGGARGSSSAEDDPLRPLGGYARSKVAVEELCARRAAAGGSVVVARPFTVIGEGQRPDMAVSLWAAQARAGRPLTVLGAEDRTRDLTDVRAVARALVALAHRGGTGTVNVGSGVPRSLAEIVDSVSRAVGAPVRIRVVPVGTEEPPDTHADTSRLQDWLGWCPELDLDDAVRRAVASVDPARPGPALALAR